MLVDSTTVGLSWNKPAGDFALLKTNYPSARPIWAGNGCAAASAARLPGDCRFLPSDCLPSGTHVDPKSGRPGAIRPALPRVKHEIEMNGGRSHLRAHAARIAPRKSLDDLATAVSAPKEAGRGDQTRQEADSAGYRSISSNGYWPALVRNKQISKQRGHLSQLAALR